MASNSSCYIEAKSGGIKIRSQSHISCARDWHDLFTTQVTFFKQQQWQDRLNRIDQELF